MNLVWMLLAGLAAVLPGAHAETMTQNLEGGMDIEITYPGEIVAGREGVVSFLVMNNGWEDKQDIAFVFSSSDMPGLAVEPPGGITIDKLAQGGSYGENVSLRVAGDAGAGTHFMNIRYSHVLIANNETPQDPFFHDIAIPVAIKEDPDVTIHTTTPESIFADAEFPISVEVVSEDIDITDVSIRIIPPKDIGFRGETSHAFSKIERGTPVGITSLIITPAEEIYMEYRLPFEIVVGYTDDVGDEKEDSQTVSVIWRPRTFMELTGDGGIWIGSFFIAPYVSLGTIIGIPAGTLISLLIRRNQNKKRRKKS